ncbi:putative spore germination protein YfkR [Paraliobacillus quinghaiensis]|uniref:Spore germination protein YfkR n=1 Tax=Paraliobacillus quinghaiensis TaxID=470815 RepID=A0A917WYZ9_9BACI|nr:Ger(x)C family spore germination protein [Paraliobacillus quinghaiensis]GGM43138.1 putative spore germination protein YfkR [Paraliobacillus quinghaiensis]
MKNFCKIIFIFILFILLTGCYDKAELEQQSYVIAIGLDKGEKEGTFSFTFQIANPEVGSTLSAGSDEEAEETISITGNDIVTATNTANSFVTKRIVLDQTKVIVVSEELARSEDFLRVIQSASRTPQIRRGVEMIVSKEKASDFLNNNDPKMEQRPHKYYQYMLNRAKQTGIIPEADLHRFFQITEGDADLFLAIYATTEKAETEDTGTEDEYIAGQIPQEGGNVTQFMGSAVFKEGMLIDIIDGQETRICNTLDKTMGMEELLSTYPDPIAPKYRISADYSQKEEPVIDVSYNKKTNHAKISVTVSFNLEILAIPSMIDYAQNEKNQKILRKSIEKNLENKTKELIQISQEEYGSDPFYWSLYIRKFFKDIPAYEKGDWNKKIFPNAEIDVNFVLKRLDFGKMLNDSNLNDVRD